METPQKPVAIPLESLSADAITGIIHEFIQREGTDYGSSEVGFETKVQQVRKQVEKGEALIVFDPNSESVQLLTKQDFKKLSQDFFA